MKRNENEFITKELYNWVNEKVVKIEQKADFKNLNLKDWNFSFIDKEIEKGYKALSDDAKTKAKSFFVNVIDTLDNESKRKIGWNFFGGGNQFFIKDIDLKLRDLVKNENRDFSYYGKDDNDFNFGIMSISSDKTNERKEAGKFIDTIISKFIDEKGKYLNEKGFFLMEYEKTIKEELYSIYKGKSDDKEKILKKVEKSVEDLKSKLEEKYNGDTKINNDLEEYEKRMSNFARSLLNIDLDFLRKNEKKNENIEEKTDFNLNSIIIPISCYSLIICQLYFLFKDKFSNEKIEEEEEDLNL